MFLVCCRKESPRAGPRQRSFTYADLRTRRCGSCEATGKESLLFRHPCFAQALEISGLVQRADLRHSEISDGLQAGDARPTIVADHQPAGFGEFGGGAGGLAFEGIGGGELGVRLVMSRIGVAPLFEPDDRLVRTRLQQMHLPDLGIPIAELGITGAEPDGSLL
jgi:hypothetical protein